MAKIIDLRSRLNPPAPVKADREDGGMIFRIRLCGPGLRWVGTVAGILGRALTVEGFYTAIEDIEPTDGAPAALCLRAGREVITESGAERCPGLVVSGNGSELPPSALQGCDEKSVLLVHAEDPEGMKQRLGFRGAVVQLPMAAVPPEPLGTAVAFIGGAARLLGEIRWTALEQAVREELGFFDATAVHRHLAMALESFDRTAPWAGRVPAVAEEIEEPSPSTV